MGSKAPSTRIPLPDYVVDEAGTGFALGAVLGSPFHFVKGLRDSPSGHRLAGAARAVRAGAPRTAGRWAAFFAVFCVPECGMAYARGGKEDSWNFIAAGAATSGFLRLRQGALSAGNAAVWSAFFFTLCEGAALAIHRALDEPRGPVRPQLPPAGSPRRLPASPGFPGILGQPIVVKEVAVADEDDSGFTGDWFGGLRQ